MLWRKSVVDDVGLHSLCVEAQETNEESNVIGLPTPFGSSMAAFLSPPAPSIFEKQSSSNKLVTRLSFFNHCS